VQLFWLVVYFIYRTILLTHAAFNAPARFSSEINKGFGSGLCVNGAVTKSDLSEYLLFLKEEYNEIREAKKYTKTDVIGYMGNQYWFLNEEVC